MSIVMEVGEVRHVRIKILNINPNVSFQIIDASYEIYEKKTQEKIKNGKCNIIEHILDVVVEAKEKGNFGLKYIYKIADETLIDEVEVCVL